MTTETLNEFILDGTEMEITSNHTFLTYLLTPWSRVLLEKLTVNFAASQEIPRVY
jgi:hypothetical protein